MQNTYRPLGKSSDAESPFSRNIEYRVTDEFYSDPPDCVVVWPPQEGPTELERAIARNLTSKVFRVIGPRERQRLARAGAYDLSHMADRKTFSQALDCRFGLEIVTGEQNSAYLLVWTQHSTSLDLSLRRTDDGVELWRARHRARRGEGGIPFSPVSVAVNAVQAGAHQSDPEVPLSVMDEGLRRVFHSLPDTRW